MRWNENEIQPKKEDKKKDEKSREMKKPGQYDMEDLAGTKDRPFLGGNPNA